MFGTLEGDEITFVLDCLYFLVPGGARVELIVALLAFIKPLAFTITDKCINHFSVVLRLIIPLKQGNPPIEKPVCPWTPRDA